MDQLIGNHIKCSSTVVINLKERPEKKKYMEKMLSIFGLKCNFFEATKHIDPKRGCLESHLSVIRDSIKKGYKNVLIMEDDAKFIKVLKNIEKPPPDWDMIYMGGTVYRVLDKQYKGYARVQTWTTHCYMINLENKKLVDDLLKVENYEYEIDRYYLEKINPNYNCYMVDPMICIQKEGFSDIEGKEVNYSFMQTTLNGLRSPESYVNLQGNYVLKLPQIKDTDLPRVSIITPTYKRRKLFSMAIRNFENFNYPKDKIEWIIVDDSPVNEEVDESVRDLLPRDKRIKYIHMESGTEPMTVAMKRNIAVSNSSNQYIVHMDDDDYYPPESILARVKLLLKYQNEGIECVGSTLIGTYNIIDDRSSMSSDGPISLSEASMAYTKKFWEDRPFDEFCKRGEHKYFTEQRLQKIIDMPYSFILIAINHKTNFTYHLRCDSKSTLKFTDSGEVANFFDTWDSDTQLFIMDLRNYLLL